VSDAPSTSSLYRETGIATFSGAVGGAASEIIALWDVPAQVICNCYAGAPAPTKAFGPRAAEIAAATGDATGAVLALILGKIGIALVAGGVAGLVLGSLALLAYRRWWKPTAANARTARNRS